jgi:hypothetical protein
VGLPDDVIAQLATDDELYAKRCLKVVDEDAELVPLLYRPAQKKLAAAREQCRRAGRPVRIIVLKSRKTGVSTQVQGWGIQECTLIPNRRALVVAHDMDTAGDLFEIGEQMYVNLPGHLDPRLKPGVVEHRSAKSGPKYLRFGEPAKELRIRGNLGVNSTFAIDTASTVESGRGKTLHFLHGSEVAFWPETRKTLALLNTIPDRPGSTVVLESTANGHNFFKRRWDRAVRGEGSYVPVFIGWLEDPACWREFTDPDERERFEVGSGPFGEEEPYLVSRGASLEQLNWRRFAIVDKAEGKIEDFKQEYPANPEEAFQASGRHRFSMVYISRALQRANRFDPEDRRPIAEPIEGVEVPPALGIFQAGSYKTRKLLRETIEVPTSTVWVPKEATGFRDTHPFWAVWERPVNDESEKDKPEDERRPPGQYIVVCDPAAGEENTIGESDFHGVHVINHRTGEQVARYHSRIDPDLLADELFLAGLYWNEALIVVEVTGGIGLAIVKTYLWKRLGYRRLYERQRIVGRQEKTEDKLGWSTDRQTKPMIEDGFSELLREETHGIRDRLTALELTTYIKDERGRSGADAEAYDDLIVAYMIGQHIKRIVPVRPLKRPGASSLGGNAPSSLTRILPPGWQ